MTANPLEAKPKRSRRPLRFVQRMRLATRLASQYAERDRSVELPALPQGAWRRLDERQTLLRRYARGRSIAAAALADLERRAFSLQLEVDAYLERLRAYVRRPPAPTARDLYVEIVALEEEFEEVEIDLSEKTLSVVAEPIELDDVELGRFRIVLRWAAIEKAEYDVVALSANKPASSDFANVVHPHVRDETLCEGEAHEPIRAALAEGRLHDFFVVVDRTLRTYNPGSAYARLEEWSGLECQDCGCRTSEERTLSCSECGDASCLNCSRSCEACDSDLCAYCAKVCRGCGGRFCGDCLRDRSPDESGVCPECFEGQENEDETNEEPFGDEGEPPAETVSEPAVHAVRVGEADLPA